MAEASSTNVQAPSNQHEGFGHHIPPSEVEGGHIPSPLHISSIEDNSCNLTSKLPTTRYVSQSLKLPQPTDSWPIKTLFTSMGADNKGPLGPSSDPRLPNTVYDRTGTNAYSSKHVYHSRGSKPDRSRSSGTTCQTSSLFCFKKFSKHSGFHQLPLRSSQKGWGSPASNKPKTLNTFLPHEHFKMESINMLKDLLRKGDYLAKIDLKDAYLTVPVWKGHQKFLQFLWRDSLLEFACLPFGLASAPRVFTKLMKPVLSILRQRGIRLIAYMDDFLIMGETQQLTL